MNLAVQSKHNLILSIKEINREIFRWLDCSPFLQVQCECTAECINLSMSQMGTDRAEWHVLRASGTCKLMHRNVRAGAERSDSLFLAPSFCASSFTPAFTTIRENIPAIRVNASSVHIGLVTSLPLVRMNLRVHCLRVMLKSCFYSVLD